MASRIGLTARTVLVGGGTVDSAYLKLSRIMKKTGIDAQVCAPLDLLLLLWSSKCLQPHPLLGLNGVDSLLHTSVSSG